MTSPPGSLGSVWRRLSQLHESPRLIAAARQPLGQAAVWMAAVPLLHPADYQLGGAVLLLAVTILPTHRHAVLSIGALAVAWWTFRQSYLTSPLFSAAVHLDLLATTLALLVLLLLLFLLFRAARALRDLPDVVRRRPLLWLHGLFVAILAAGWALGHYGLVHDTAASAALALLALRVPFVMWTCSYLVMAGRQGKLGGTTFVDQLFWLAPTWSAGDTPMGKGWVYLRKHEVTDDDALARSQLAGLKLLILSNVWRVLLAAIDSAVLGHDTILGATLGGGTDFPGLEALLEGERMASIPTAWAALYLELVRRVLSMAVVGHVIVGALRLLGFHVFRSTYKPLLAESVVEFWSRYFFYFKELMVDAFFYPTFLRVFKKHPRLRAFAAVFAAACLGNMYYHYVLSAHLIVAADLSQLFTRFAPRWVYCIALAVGIWVSMERQAKVRAGQPAFAGLASTGDATSRSRGFVRLRCIAGVWTFFAMLDIWVVGEAGFVGRIAFMLSLVGL